MLQRRNGQIQGGVNPKASIAQIPLPPPSERQAGAVSFVSRNAPSADYLYTVHKGMDQSTPSSSEFPALSLVDVEGDL